VFANDTYVWSTRSCSALTQSSQGVIQRLDRAWQKFFKRQGSAPKFKKSRLCTSFTLKQAGWKYEGGNRVRIGRRDYKFALSRPVTGSIKTVTIKRDRVGDLWICFSSIEDIALPEPPGQDAVKAPIGIDWGLRSTMVFSDGRYPARSPLYLSRSLDELRRLQRRLSKRRHRNGGRRTLKTEADRKRIARLRRRIADQRRNRAFETAHEFCDEFDGIAIEDLSAKWMQRTGGRKASDIAWGDFTSILEWTCMKRGIVLKKVDAKNTSKTCSVCRAINEDLTIKEREWTCECGVHHDRDVNAAKNILRRAFRSPRDSVSGEGEVIPQRVATVA